MNVSRDVLQELLDALKTRGEYEIQVDMHTADLQRINTLLAAIIEERNQNAGKRKVYTSMLEFLKALVLCVVSGLIGAISVIAGKWF